MTLPLQSVKLYDPKSYLVSTVASGRRHSENGPEDASSNRPGIVTPRPRARKDLRRRKPAGAPKSDSKPCGSPRKMKLLPRCMLVLN